MNASQVLEREFLEIRARILEIAASLDRIDRAAGDVSLDANRQLLSRGIDLLSAKESGRAEQVQLLFSNEYVSDWQSDFQMKPRS